MTITFLWLDANMEKKHNYFYKITNLINGKYYYGIHSTNKLDDGYFGSGRTIIKAIKKYGKENFTKEIIADYQTRKEASDHERKVVTIELVECEKCYNLQTGGNSEFIMSEESRKKMSESTSGEKHPMFGKMVSDVTKIKIRDSNVGKKRSIESRKKMSESKIGKYKGEESPHFGKTHSEGTLKKLRQAKIGKYYGENNPFYGRTHSEDTKIKMKNRSSCKPCKIFDTTYISVAEASRVLKMSSNNITRRLKDKRDKFKDWNYCEGII